MTDENKQLKEQTEEEKAVEEKKKQEEEKKKRIEADKKEAQRKFQAQQKLDAEKQVIFNSLRFLQHFIEETLLDEADRNSISVKLTRSATNDHIKTINDFIVKSNG